MCRICLATDVKMFSLESGVLKNCMESITGFNVSNLICNGCNCWFPFTEIKFIKYFQDNKSNIEGLPQFVCYECAVHLNKYYHLLERSKTAQTTLLDIFAQNSQVGTAVNYVVKVIWKNCFKL